MGSGEGGPEQAEQTADHMRGSGVEPCLEIQARLGDEEKRLLTDFKL